jgi:hypothetical protein
MTRPPLLCYRAAIKPGIRGSPPLPLQQQKKWGQKMKTEWQWWRHWGNKSLPLPQLLVMKQNLRQQ